MMSHRSNSIVRLQKGGKIEELETKIFRSLIQSCADCLIRILIRVSNKAREHTINDSSEFLALSAFLAVTLRYCNA